MRKLMLWVLVTAVMGSVVEAEGARRKPRVGPAVEVAGTPAAEGEPQPIYLEVWVRVFVTNNAEANPTYRVMMTSEGPYEGAAAEAELELIISRGGYRIGTDFYPLHMIERIRLHAYPSKP